jgi:hypothetical protein
MAGDVSPGGSDSWLGEESQLLTQKALCLDPMGVTHPLRAARCREQMFDDFCES